MYFLPDEKYILLKIFLSPRCGCSFRRELCRCDCQRVPDAAPACRPIRMSVKIPKK